MKKKSTKISRSKHKTNTSETKKKPKIGRKNFTTKRKEKIQQRQSSRLRNQPRKDYKTFTPQT